MVRIKFTDQALADMDQIAEFISKDAPKFAAVFIEKIFEKVSFLRKYPSLVEKFPNLIRKNFGSSSMADIELFIKLSTNRL